MEQELLDALENKTVKRPIFLTVLCILTWIGSALFLFFGSNKLIDQMRLLNKYTGILGFKPDKYYYWDIWNSILFLLCCLVCIVAAIAMWKLKRWGFYVYATAQIAPVIMATLTALQIPKILGRMDPAFIPKALIPVAFIVLYAINLKYMRRSNKRMKTSSIN